MNIRAPKDFWSGIMFLAFAAVALLTARGYSLGSAGRMGPGYFPMLLGGVLALLGLVLVLRSLVIEGEASAGFASSAYRDCVRRLPVRRLASSGSGSSISLIAVTAVSAFASREFAPA